MSKPILGYWNIRALAEPIVYLLHYKNVGFEDKRYNLDDRPSWENDKFNLNLDFPNLPYYIDDNVRLTQSTTILRYLAEKYGLDGKTEQEKDQISLVEQQIVDFRTHLFFMCFEKVVDEIKSQFEEKIPYHAKVIAEFLGNKKYLIGDSLTYVDFLAYDCIDFCEYLIPNVLDEFPNLKEYQERFENLPELQSYLKTGTSRIWPISASKVEFGSKDADQKQK
ncbi:glutathione S-transferase class-mu 26 kDa isozyme 47 [Caerostris darwini]|uniref:glutathione transferase n=1 Tax=Caerostris darwini TaxID=1538125 RepID=A0AAV4UJN1_9ARAC|nr:glutathione S-transferase class-mu 26 kDa isozyme 47 [Caerostris darwini]